MRVIAGKQVLTELSELVDPAHTALVVIDMQRDFLEPDGVVASLGVDLSVYNTVRQGVKTLISSARGAYVPVLHVQNTTLPGGMSDSPAQLHFTAIMHSDARRGAPPVAYTVAGTRGHEFVAEAQPLDGEVVVRKHRSSAFWGTDLAQILRSNGIAAIVIAGCTTEGCVESTARDALFNDFYVVVAEDCVGSDDAAQHEASLFLMRHRFDVVNSTRIRQSWSTTVASLPSPGPRQ